MHDYLQPNSDGLRLRESGPWAAEKLDYLARYIGAFETSMRTKRWRQRSYIDLFAGPGKCLVPETGAVFLGSPMIAMTTRFPFTHYYFADLDPANIAALRERCNGSPLGKSVDYFIGDSNQEDRAL